MSWLTWMWTLQLKMMMPKNEDAWQSSHKRFSMSDDDTQKLFSFNGNKFWENCENNKKTKTKTALPYMIEIWRNLLCDATQPGTLHRIQEHKLPIGGIRLLLWWLQAAAPQQRAKFCTNLPEIKIWLVNFQPHAFYLWCLGMYVCDLREIVHTLNNCVYLSQLKRQCPSFLCSAFYFYFYFFCQILWVSKLWRNIPIFLKKLIEFPLKTIILQYKPKKRKMLLGTVLHETTLDPTISLILFLFLFLFLNFMMQPQIWQTSQNKICLNWQHIFSSRKIKQ